MIHSSLLFQPLFGVTLTLVVYVFAQKMSARWNRLHPLFFTAGSLILFLLVTGIPYEAYKIGGDLITFCLGPTIVALGIPLYKYAQQIKKSFWSIFGGMAIGSISSILSSAALIWYLGGSRDVLLSMLPKSVTTPIALELVKYLGGVPALGGVFTTLTGLLGSMIGPEFLRLCGVRSDIAIGTAIGTASHGIGTARIIRESELQGSISSFSMVLNGIFTSVLMVPIYIYFH